MKKKPMSVEERKHCELMFRWALLVIIVNAISIFFKGIGFINIAALIVTVYALYRMVVYENKNNRNSKKYYDYRGLPK